MITERVRILGKASSINVRKVLWACDEIGAAYDREDWGSGFQSTETEEFLALNPNAMVPVVQIGAYTLWESNTICRFLASFYQRSDLLPVDAWDRALVEKWMDWQIAELNPTWRYAFMALVRQHAAYSDAAQIKRSSDQWHALVGIIDDQLERTGAFIIGERFTLADIVIGLSLNRWYMTPFERPEYPAVRDYFGRLKRRAAFVVHGCNGIP